jgi:hypothetical protein
MRTLGNTIGFYTDLAQHGIGLRNIGSFLCHHGSIAICADLLYICALHSDFADACYAQPIQHSANRSDGVFSPIETHLRDQPLQMLCHNLPIGGLSASLVVLPKFGSLQFFSKICEPRM